MILITETPHRLPPSTWTARDRADFCRRIHAAAERSDAPVWLCSTPAEQLATLGDDEEFPAMRQLAEQHGPDAPIYMADTYTGHEGRWQVEPIDEYEACVAWLRSDLRELQIEEM